MTTTLMNNPWQALMAPPPAARQQPREPEPPRKLPRHETWYGRPVLGTPREWSGTPGFRRMPLSQVQYDCLMSLRYGFAVHEVANAEEAAFQHNERSLGYTMVTLRSLLKLGLIRMSPRDGKGYEITDHGLFLLCFFKLRS